MQCNNIIQSYNNSGTSNNQSPPASGSTSIICNDSMPRDLRPMTFHEFRKQKEQDRCSKFSISKTKKRSISTANKKARLAQEVKVQVGVVRESVEDGRLKKIKGRTIPVLMKTTMPRYCSKRQLRSMQGTLNNLTEMILMSSSIKI